MTVSRIWLLATVPLFVVGVIAIVRLAVGLVRFTRDAVVVSLPVVSEQTVVLPRPDRYAVLAQGRLAERGLGDLRYSVIAEADGREVSVSPVYVRSQSTSMDGTVRLELFSFSANAGAHTIRVAGIDSARDYRQNRIVIARQSRGQLAVRIVALVAAGILTLGCLVGSSLLIAGSR
jgi:hypothetical protein